MTVDIYFWIYCLHTLAIYENAQKSPPKFAGSADKTTFFAFVAVHALLCCDYGMVRAQ